MHARCRLTAGTVALACAAALTTAPARSETYGDRLGAHSMLYLNSSPAEQRALFRASHDARVRSIRLDFTMGAVFGFLSPPDFTAVDRVNALARRSGLQVDAVLTGLPFWLADCPPGIPFEAMSKCPPRPDAEAEWSRMVAAVVRRSPAVRHWELGNEPDVAGGRFFIGTPAAYARMAAVTARAIRAARPSATIVLGGTSRLDRRFLRAVLADGRNPLAGQIDVAAVHLRGSVSRMRAGGARLRPLLPPHGHPRTALDHRDRLPVESRPPVGPHARRRRARPGALDRARPTRAIDGGAARVFVTFRDGPEFGSQSAFASEGVVRWPQLGAGGRAIPKPAFAALRRLAAMPIGSAASCRTGRRPGRSRTVAIRPGRTGRGS